FRSSPGFRSSDIVAIVVQHRRSAQPAAQAPGWIFTSPAGVLTAVGAVRFACALPFPATSKKVYDSVIVRTSFGIFGSMTNTTGHSFCSPGFSVYSLKQKHSSLLKYGVACLGA